MGILKLTKGKTETTKEKWVQDNKDNLQKKKYKCNQKNGN